MLLSDICRRAETGGILDSMLGSRVTSAFMSLRSSSNWFSTVRAWQRKKKPVMCVYAAIFNKEVSYELKINLSDITITNANLSDDSSFQVFNCLVF